MNDSPSRGRVKPQDATKSQDPTWRVFYTHARAEKKSYERLEQAGIQSFLPTYASFNTWSDRKKRIVQPLFSNYIFAHVNERDRLRVLQTQGIAYCVKLGARFAELSEKEIQQIKITQQDQENIVQWSYSMPQPGETVSVTQGPMKGLKGEVLRHNGASYVVIRLESIRQAVRVLVPTDWIVRVSERMENA